MLTNKYIYAFVITVVFSAWFSSYRIPSIPKTKSASIDQEPSRIVSDIAAAGVKVSDWQAGGKCNIEYINGTIWDNHPYAVGREGGLILTGWTLDESKERLPDSVIIRFTDIDSKKEFFSKAQIGIKRPDVQAHFNLSTKLVASGFRLITYVQDIALGEYDITLLTVYPDCAYICSNGRKINVR